MGTEGPGGSGGTGAVGRAAIRRGRGPTQAIESIKATSGRPGADRRRAAGLSTRASAARTPLSFVDATEREDNARRRGKVAGRRLANQRAAVRAADGRLA
uniref:Uncharacterized protein n=1 Tax=Plectus sambesii TaxID=2011161 RepID=A0A914V8N9_9BILA